jgi:2-oxo-4-hydroxy-4-carboxy--5-ureidoimidazoline (OHCU) decarboxylase
MTPSELHATMLCMETYGGSFMTNMAAALRFADPMNRERILKAFPEITAKYGPAGQLHRFHIDRVTA